MGKGMRQGEEKREKRQILRKIKIGRKGMSE